MAEDPSIRLDGRGVNAFGRESGNTDMTTGRRLPWLQDDALVDAWGLWAVTQRDCILLDTLGRFFAVYNLTSQDLAVPANYAALKSLLLAAHAAGP